MSSLAYADPAIEIPAYIHWPQPEKPQRPITLWVTLGIAAVVSLFSGISVANAWSHMPDYDPSRNAGAPVAFLAQADLAAPSSKLVTFTPPPDYNSNEAPVIPAVYDEPMQASTAVDMKGEATFDQADFAAVTGSERSEQPAACVGACTQATPTATDSGTGYDTPEAPIPYEAMTPVSASQNIPN